MSLSEANEKAYRALRYGVNVQKGVGAFQETVGLVDWERPERNDFGLAQEVVLAGRGERRPDVVLYVNGIAVGVLELKRADVSVGEGVRQAITLQEGRESFFSTVQFVFAGNDSEGLRYGTVGTGEKFFVSWKEDGAKPEGVEAVGARLDVPLAQMCGKARLLDLMKEFVVFDKGVKKVPRPHQYHGVKAAQERIKKREGGVIWHTQGSGKSILMVLLAKWILQNDPEARVLVVTDREELDTQIAGVMRDAGVIPKDAGDVRVATRAEFVARLEETAPRFFCALVHKFNPAELEGETPKMRGRFYVFVDECHRTQGGLMNRQMKRWMKGAIFLGFTGTPLLRQDKATTEEVFGTYIHTYKFGEAVEDGVVLDLVYEARDVAQRLSSRDEIDKWFAEKTSGLNAHQRALLRKRWARLEEITNTEGRLSRIVEDVVMDFDAQPRLRSSRGTAMLVASSIYDACRYYRSFLGTELGGRCGIVTSFEPNAGKISTEPLGGEERYKFDTYKQHVLREGETGAQYEARVKDDFINRPEKMKLLIVVDKLLTGFDAPSCSTIYLDKQLKDHNLFQAICRTNRLDGDDKPHGCIVDYGRLFANVQHAIAVYNSEELDLEGASEAENNVFMKEALREGRVRLDKAREAWSYQCGPILAPRELEQVFAYFCGAADDARGLSEREPLRVQFYKASAAFLRAFAELANELDQAGYSKEEVLGIKRDKELCGQWLMAVKMCAGEHLDLKPFEADMRELLDAYIEADEVRSLGGLGGMTLVEAIVKTGLHDVIARHLNAGGKLSKDGIAEVIIHNLRKAILRGELTDPKYYQELSRILDDLIQKGRDDAASYESFLKGIEELARMLSGGGHSGLPAILEGKPEAQVLFRNLDALGGAFVCPSDEGERAALALKLHETVKRHAQPPWRGDQRRERKIKQHLFEVLHDKAATEALFEIVVQQVGY